MDLCVVHVIQRLLRRTGIGCRLFTYSAFSFLKEVQSTLPLLQVPGAGRFTLKAFRAGRATSLAKSGHPIGVILAAGEWKSAAFARYCHAEDLDVSSVLAEIFDMDED